MQVAKSETLTEIDQMGQVSQLPQSSNNYFAVNQRQSKENNWHYELLGFTFTIQNIKQRRHSACGEPSWCPFHHTLRKKPSVFSNEIPLYSCLISSSHPSSEWGVQQMDQFATYKARSTSPSSRASTCNRCYFLIFSCYLVSNSSTLQLGLHFTLYPQPSSHNQMWNKCD